MIMRRHEVTNFIGVGGLDDIAILYKIILQMTR